MAAHRQQEKKSTAVGDKGCERKKKPVKGLVPSGMWRLHLYGQIPPSARIGPAQTQQVTTRSNNKKYDMKTKEGD